MTARQIHQRAIEIDDQNRRMAGLVASFAIAALSAIIATLIWIF